MGVLPKVLGLTVAGVTVIALYLAVSVLSALFGGVADPSPAHSPLGFAVYLGLALTAVFTSIVMYLASTGGGSAQS
ncbi:hypothetical protein [Paramagnetospirillum magneticum]|uniref:Uncharacterized protein n=1 Tax=Paramagnetospirillum magneticum (strain ATCC 700264 / AMB-1) TaxID=342108 RepID=Q2W2Q5_PARM1|nr:hypothetical protein [Paramagnetospirillum magneticum]BAE51870.1 hypothetical protein amb3066 [Paramagnetospirillum magneticum AMB-1]